MTGGFKTIAAVVMAAGQSKRMGTPKMALPWGKTTVIGRVVSVLQESGIQEIVVVTGGDEDEVKRALSGASARIAPNPQFKNTEMLRSFQIGITSLPEKVSATLVVLGDQPQIEMEVVRKVCERFLNRASKIVVPSFQMRRGHPWLVERALWSEILGLDSSMNLRSFLNTHADEIDYILTDRASILADLDTPEDYRDQRPK